MNSHTYRVVTEGEIVPGHNREQVINNFAQLLKLENQPERLQQLFSGHRVILKKDLSEHQARAFAARIQALGLHCALLATEAANSNIAPLATELAEKATKNQPRHDSLSTEADQGLIQIDLRKHPPAKSGGDLFPPRRFTPVSAIALLLPLLIGGVLYYTLQYQEKVLPVTDTETRFYDSATPQVSDSKQPRRDPVDLHTYSTNESVATRLEQAPQHTEHPVKKEVAAVQPEQPKPEPAQVPQAQTTHDEAQSPIVSEAKPSTPAPPTSQEADTLAKRSNQASDVSDNDEKQALHPLIQPRPMFQDKLVTGKLGPKMRPIPAGSFAMGDTLGIGDETEKPVRIVTITKPFAISMYEVTFAEYDRFARATGRPLPRDQRRGRNDRPVIHVSWNDAQAYAEWLSQQTGRKYRLPTEAEWEYVARAGKDTRYTWGDNLGEKNANCKGCGSLWDNMQLAPVGQFSPNAYGIYDLHGNAWEWVSDCYNNTYNKAPTDGSAWQENNCNMRALRGGSWRGTEETLRTTKRHWYQATFQNDMTGFRLVRELDTP